MPSIRTPRARRSLVLAAVVGFAGAVEEAAVGAEHAVHDAIRASLPKYDPKSRAETAVVGERVKPRAVDAAAAYGVTDRSDESPTTVGAPEAAVILPRIVVRPSDGPGKEESPVTLPRLVVRPPTGKDQAAEAFETPAARDARLVKKHLNAFDRFVLNRFTLPLFGLSKEQRARQAEVIEQGAKRLNEMAELLDLSRSEHGENAEDRALRELYLDLYAARPK